MVQTALAAVSSDVPSWCQVKAASSSQVSVPSSCSFQLACQPHKATRPTRSVGRVPKSRSGKIRPDDAQTGSWEGDPFGLREALPRTLPLGIKSMSRDVR